MKYSYAFDGQGLFIGINKHRLSVKQHAENIEELDLSSLSSLVLTGAGIAVSTAALLRCAEEDIPVILLDHLHRPISVMVSPRLRRTNDLATRQLSFYGASRAASFVCGIIENKIRQQHAVIHYHARSLRLDKPVTEKINYYIDSDIQSLRQIAASDVNLEHCKNEIFLIEARAAKNYWQAFARLLPAEFGFVGREHRGAVDPCNRLLNYGYAMLSGSVLRAILLAGLDPTQGLLHHRQVADYPLLYDLMEPFRPLVDHTVLECLHQQKIAVNSQDGGLRAAVLRHFRARWFENQTNPAPWTSYGQSLEAKISQQIKDYLHVLNQTKS